MCLSDPSLWLQICPLPDDGRECSIQCDMQYSVTCAAIYQAMVLSAGSYPTLCQDEDAVCSLALMAQVLAGKDSQRGHLRRHALQRRLRQPACMHTLVQDVWRQEQSPSLCDGSAISSSPPIVQ